MKNSVISVRSVVNLKDTELGPLPEEWQVVKLGEVVEEIDSGDWGSENLIEHKNSVRCYVLRGTDFNQISRNSITNCPIRYLSWKSYQQRKVLHGDLLVEISGGSKDQPTGRIVLIKDDLLLKSEIPVTFSNFVKRLRIAKSCDQEFFYQYWSFLYHNGVTRTYEKRTTGIRNFKLIDFLSNEFIPLPPLAEQRAIAHVLRTVQEAKQAGERVIAALRELKKSLMRALFTYGVKGFTTENTENTEKISVNSVRSVVNLKDTELGPLPEEWQVVRLGDLVAKGALWMKNGFPQGEHNQTGLGIPHLRPFNITDTGDITLSQSKYVSSPAENSPYWVLPGDVIFNNTNSEELVGKTAYFNLNGKFVISNHMTLIRASSDQVNAYWLSRYLYWLWSQGVFQGLCRRHVNQASVSLERLKQLTIPLPPLAEQRAIARILQAVDRRIAAEEAYARALGDLFQTLLHELMSGRRRVKFTTENTEHTEKKQKTLCSL